MRATLSAGRRALRTIQSSKNCSAIRTTSAAVYLPNMKCPDRPALSTTSSSPNLRPHPPGARSAGVDRVAQIERRDNPCRKFCGEATPVLPYQKIMDVIGSPPIGRAFGRSNARWQPPRGGRDLPYAAKPSAARCLTRALQLQQLALGRGLTDGSTRGPDSSSLRANAQNSPRGSRKFYGDPSSRTSRSHLVVGRLQLRAAS